MCALESPVLPSRSARRRARTRRTAVLWSMRHTRGLGEAWLYEQRCMAECDTNASPVVCKAQPADITDLGYLHPLPPAQHSGISSNAACDSGDGYTHVSAALDAASASLSELQARFAAMDAATSSLSELEARISQAQKRAHDRAATEELINITVAGTSSKWEPLSLNFPSPACADAVARRTIAGDAVHYDWLERECLHCGIEFQQRFGPPPPDCSHWDSLCMECFKHWRLHLHARVCSKRVVAENCDEDINSGPCYDGGCATEDSSDEQSCTDELQEYFTDGERGWRCNECGATGWHWPQNNRCPACDE